MYGMSPTTHAFGAPRRTAAVWRIMSSIVTGRVLSKPSIVMPRLSPTRIMSTPASSWRYAVG